MRLLCLCSGRLYPSRDHTRKMEAGSLRSHRRSAVKSKLQRGRSYSRYRTRRCDRAIQSPGYDVNAKIFQEETYMDYFNAFWTGGLICALVQILLDRTKLMPGRIMVLLVCTGSVKRSRNLSAICGIRRCRCLCPTAWFRQCSLERNERSHRQKRADRTLYGWLHCLRSGSLRCTDLFLSCKSGL